MTAYYLTLHCIIECMALRYYFIGEHSLVFRSALLQEQKVECQRPMLNSIHNTQKEKFILFSTDPLSIQNAEYDEFIKTLL